MKTQTERMRRRAKLEGKVGRRPIPKGRASARAVRSILAMDSEIKAEDIEKALDVLRGKVASNEDLDHVLRRKEVEELLHVHHIRQPQAAPKGSL